MHSIRLAYSPCPNDTFLFEALAHGRLAGSEAFSFQISLHDIAELNRLAAAEEAEMIKLSFAAYAQLRDRYELLETGSALGEGVGPLLVARQPVSPAEMDGLRIAIPGRETTAHLLLQHFAPGATKRVVMPFEQIMPAVERGEADAGVIIHESRFTYPEHGLVCLQDLGDYWEETTGHPIPLGGIAVRKSLPAEVKRKLDELLGRSLAFAQAHPEQVWPYVRQHAQEMAEDVMRRHIELYVNDYTRALGERGHAAIEVLCQKADELRAGLSESEA